MRPSLLALLIALPACGEDRSETPGEAPGEGEGEEGEGEEGEGEEGEGEGEGEGEEGEGEGEGEEGEGEGEGEGEEGEGEGEPPAACGVGAGLECPETDYCFHELGECGVADAVGFCRPRPVLCAPGPCPQVCGCDGVTYCDECGAAANGVSVLTRGPCEEEPAPQGEACVQISHPDITVVGEGDECALIDFGCDEGEMMYDDGCTCGCIAKAGEAFACDDDLDCVPEDCCRPTGCVARAAQECQQDPCCMCEDCRPAVAGCGCVEGLCRTWWDVDACQ